jgi:hypothetical protein
MASEGGGVDASRLEDWPERRMVERVVEDMRGMMAIVTPDILHIYLVRSLKGGRFVVEIVKGRTGELMG